MVVGIGKEAKTTGESGGQPVAWWVLMKVDTQSNNNKAGDIFTYINLPCTIYGSLGVFDALAEELLVIQK